jgi:chromosome segregation ATPase
MSRNTDRSKSTSRWSRLKRARGASRHTAPEPHALELEACDRVEVAADQAMVRVAGRWTPAAPVEVALQVGHDILLPLPPGPSTGADGIWRAAFALESADDASPLALLTDSGTRVVLAGAEAAGAPAASTVAPEPEVEPLPLPLPDPEPEPEPEPLPDIAAERDPDLEEQLANALDDLADAHAIADQLRKRCELSERGVAEFREKLVQAWSEANEMRLLLEERESAHVKATERARKVDTRIAAVEQRLAERQRALVESREELKRHCEALESELVSRARSESSARARAEDAAEREAHLRAEVDAAVARSEQAQASVEALRDQIDAMRAAADQAERELTNAREREAELQAQAAESNNVKGELEAARASAEQAQQELAAARERMAQLEEHTTQGVASSEQAHAAAEAARAELEAAHASAEQAQQELASARDREAKLQADSKDALARFEQVQWEAETARKELEAARAAADSANAELTEARDELSTLRKNTISLSQSEHALRTKLDSLTRGDVGDSGRLQRRQKVSARAYRDALAQVEVEQAERQRLEAEAASLAARVRELESMKPPAVEPAAASEALAKRLKDMEEQLEARTQVEADLRRLFETSQEELETARAEAAEARGRLASTPVPAPAGDNGEPHKAKESQPWTGVDQELIDRIAKANQLAGSDG